MVACSRRQTEYGAAHRHGRLGVPNPIGPGSIGSAGLFTGSSWTALPRLSRSAGRLGLQTINTAAEQATRHPLNSAQRFIQC